MNKNSYYTEKNELSFSTCIYLLTVCFNVQDNGAAVMLSRQYIGCFVCGIICCQRKCLVW